MLNLFQFCTDLIVEENKQSKCILKKKLLASFFNLKQTSEDGKYVKDYVAIVNAFL